MKGVSFLETNTEKFFAAQTAIAFLLAATVSPWWLAILAIRLDIRD